MVSEKIEIPPKILYVDLALFKNFAEKAAKINADYFDLKEANVRFQSTKNFTFAKQG